MENSIQDALTENERLRGELVEVQAFLTRLGGKGERGGL